MNPQEFAAKIKSKYPQYKDVDDVELAQKVVAKYPVYASQVKFEQPTRSLTDKLLDNPITRGIQSIFPGKKLGEAIGSSVVGFKELAKGNTENAQALSDEINKNVPSIAGDTVAAAALPASLAAGGTGSIVKNMAQFGGISAVAGAGESLAEGNTIKQSAIDAFQSGLTGAAVSGALGVVGKAVNKFVEKAPESIYNNAIRVTQRIKSKPGKNPVPELLKDGTWGSLGSIKKTAEEGIAQSKAAITAKVAKVPGGATYGEIRQAAIADLKKGMGNLYSDAEIAAMVDKVPVAALKKKGLLKWSDIDAVRSQLGSLVGDNKWMMANPTENVKASQAVYRAMASLLQKTTNTAKEFATESKYIQTKKIVDRAIDIADSKYGLGFKDLVSFGVGTVTGAASGDSVGEKFKNSLLFGAGALTAERIATSPKILTGIATALNKLKSLPTDSAGNISRAALMRLFAEALTDPQIDQKLEE